MRPPDERRCICCDAKFRDLSDIAEEATGPTTCKWRLCVSCQSNGARFERGARKTWWLLRRDMPPVKCWEQRNYHDEVRRLTAKAVAKQPAPGPHP